MSYVIDICHLGTEGGLNKTNTGSLDLGVLTLIPLDLAEKNILSYTSYKRRSRQMVNALDSVSSGRSSSPGRGTALSILDKTLDFHTPLVFGRDPESKGGFLWVNLTPDS